MSAPLTYAELFAGAGGLSLGLELAGWEPVAHAEIEPHARAVLRKHWPDCRLDGDVSAINGADYAGVTLLSGGSPCQDLSVAGKRAGMVEGSGTRSSLFFEQVRIWQESGAPYFLWENVLGAFSSNEGRDFAAVLAAICGSAVAVPADGWRSAGVAVGSAGIVAWRVLDAQFHGLAQRRRRVFVLGARAGGVDPAEVLALSEGVRGDPSARGETREATAGDAGGGTDESRVITFVERGREGGRSLESRADGVINTLMTLASANDQVLFTMASGQANAELVRDGEPSLTTQHDGPPILFTGAKNDSEAVPTEAGAAEAMRALPRADDAEAVQWGAREQLGLLAPEVLRSEVHGGSIRREAERGDPSKQLAVPRPQDGAKGSVPAVRRGERQGRTSSGRESDEQRARELGTDLSGLSHQGTSGSAFVRGAGMRAEASAEGVLLNARAADAPPRYGVPRRLVPTETEALMGWPRNHTAVGIDEQGREYALSDTARYRLCGNGVSSPVAGWIAWRLRWALEQAAT